MAYVSAYEPGVTTHTSLSFLQPSNAVESIFVTEAGIVMRVKEVQSQKARKSMVLISKDLKKLDGVEEALVGMGTDLNRDIAHNLGLVTPEFETITANDFFVAIRCENDDVMAAALAKVDELLTKKKENSSANYYPPTLSSAIKMDDQLNLAIISVPGKYAAGVADPSCFAVSCRTRQGYLL